MEPTFRDNSILHNPANINRTQSNSPSTPDKVYEPSEIDKLINAKIQRFDRLPKLLAFPRHGDLTDVDHKDLSQHQWSPEHWAVWCRKIVELAKKSPKGNLSLNEKGYIQDIFHERVIKQNPSCPIGALSQIMQALGNLNYNDPQTSDWMFNSSYKNTESFTPQEIYMFVHGALKMNRKNAIQEFLDRLTYALKKNPRKVEELRGGFDSKGIDAIRPQGISCLLKACNRTHTSGILAETLLDLAEQKFLRFNTQEIVDLIAGLDPRFFADPAKALRLLEKCEDHLASLETIPTDTLSIATYHFALSRYIPKKLLLTIEKRISDSAVVIYDRFNLLNSSAMLGLNIGYPFAKQFTSLPSFLI